MAGTVSETYTYAGDGVRLSAVRGNRPQDVTRFLVDRSFGLPQLALERDGNDKLLRRYTYGLDLLAQTTPTKGPYWYHHDGLGSVSDVTSPGGASLWWMEYTPFGAARASASTSQAPLNFFRFTGEYADTATALYHLRARQYDRSTGRFLSTDQLIPPLTDPYVGAYVYVRNNPCRYVDPAGLAQTPTAGGSCPIAAFAAALGLSGLGSVDVALGLGAIFLAPSVLGELALLPAEAAALYLHYVLIELALQAATRDCSQIRIEINPFR